MPEKFVFCYNNCDFSVCTTSCVFNLRQLTEQAEGLKKQVYQLDLEKCVLEKAAEVLKKDQGIRIPTLTNCEKATVVHNHIHRANDYIRLFCFRHFRVLG